MAFAHPRSTQAGSRMHTCEAPGCGEPSHGCRQIERKDGSKIWICPACMSKLNALVESRKLRKRNDERMAKDIRDVRKNSFGDRRRGAEEIYYGSEYD